jgi:hypothetical protein
VRREVDGRCGSRRSTILGVIRERSFAADVIVPFASERSAGPVIDYGGHGPVRGRAVRRGHPGLVTGSNPVGRAPQVSSIDVLEVPAAIGLVLPAALDFVPIARSACEPKLASHCHPIIQIV